MFNKYTLWGISTFALMFAVPAFAQDVPESGANEGLGEIVVTARKTTENLQKAAATVTVVSAGDLVTKGIKIPTDLDKLLPSASLRQEGAVAQNLYIRGVGSVLDFPWTSPGSVITYNGIIIPRYGTMGVLFDLSSVELIAGPQGTLYGGSAAGGAVNFLTQKPKGNYSGTALLDVGNYGQVRVAASQNFPLSDSLSSLTSVDYNRHGPYESGGFFTSDRIEGRQSFLYKPSEDFSALVFVSGYQEKGKLGSHAHYNFNPLPKDPWDVPATGAAGNPINADYTYQDSQTYVVGANIDWNIGAGTLTYIPGYVRITNDYAFLVPIGGFLDVQNEEDQHSQELRWSQKIGALRLSAGLFWMQNKTNFNDGISLPFLPAALGYYLHIPTINQVDQTRTSYSVFAQAVYSVSDQLRVTLGGRLSKDKIAAVGTGGAGPFVFNRSQTRPDWKVGVEYEMTPEIFVYGNIQTGYIPFGYNPDVGSPAEVLPESKLLAYSAGFKSRLLDNKLEINAEAFYYDYSDFQAFAIDNLTQLSQVNTAKKSRIYGAEVTARWRIADHSKFDISIVTQQANYTNFIGRGFDFSGYRMANAPRLNVIAGLEHGVELGGLGFLSGRVQTQYNSGSWGVFVHQGTFQRAYMKTDLTLSYQPTDSEWKVQGYVNNLENKATFGGLGATSPGVPGAGALAPPRTYGVRVSTAW